MNVFNIQQMNNGSWLGIFFSIIAIIFIAEMGDKSQILVMTFSTRYKLKQVIIGAGLAIIALNALAVIMGSLITSIIPIQYIQLFAALLFILFGIISFREEKDKDEKDRIIRVSPTLTVAISFFIAEFGDKTQLATMAFAAQYNAPVLVFVASVIALMIADLMGVVAGVAINKYIPKKQIRILSGMIFMGFGFFGLSELMPKQQLSSMMNTVTIIIGVGALIVLYLIFSKSKDVT